MYNVPPDVEMPLREREKAGVESSPGRGSTLVRSESPRNKTVERIAFCMRVSTGLERATWAVILNSWTLPGDGMAVWSCLTAVIVMLPLETLSVCTNHSLLAWRRTAVSSLELCTLTV